MSIILKNIARYSNTMKSKLVNGKRLFGCETCQGEAQFLVAYSKLYWHGRNTLEYPALICEACRRDKKAEAYHIDRGGEQQIYELSFNEIAGFKPYQVSRLCSLKGRELNYLHLKKWRDKVWEIHFACRPAQKNNP